MTTDNFCIYLENRGIQTGQTGGQWHSDTSLFSIPCPDQPSLVALPVDVEHAVDGGDDHADIGQRVPELGNVEAHLFENFRIFIGSPYPGACSINLFTAVIYRFL